MIAPQKPGPAVPIEPMDEAIEKEPFDVWWPKYLTKVDESISAAEQYLEVPAETISSIMRDPDYIATVKAYAVIEPMLNDLISTRRPRELFGSLAAGEPQENFQAFVSALNISGRAGKVALAKGLGLLNSDQVRFIEGVARVRNRYAHNVRNMHRSLVDILTEEQQSNAKIVANVTGLGITLPSKPLGPYLKMFMYHRLADYLSDALKTLRPPPLPAGGLLSGLSALFPAPPDQSPP